MDYFNKSWIFLLLSYFFIVVACKDAVEPGPTPDDFTKEKRELLGDIFHQTILNAPQEFPILNHSTEGDSLIQSYLQTLYNQTTQRIQLDRSSSVNNRWNPERPWTVTVLDDHARYAFSLPGGYFYISSEFLKSMTKGYEVYYLMAFEAANVSNKYLLNHLISEYSTVKLLNITDQPTDFSQEELEDIVNYIKKDLAYEEVIVQEIDKETAQVICETSIFDRLGIISLLDILHSQEQWLDTRPSYGNRLEYLNTLRVNDCGSIKSTGAYKKKVLDNF